MAKDAYYFSHDSNARNDEKILMLRASHGMEGYGIYWALIESMFENEDTRLRHDKVAGLSLSLNIDMALLKQIISTCVTQNLFSSNDTYFWSDSLIRRKNKYKELREKRVIAGKKGAEKRWEKENEEPETIEKPELDSNAMAMPLQNQGDAIAKNSKGKEIEKEIEKKKKIQKKAYGEFSNVNLSDEEYSKLLDFVGKKHTEAFIEKISIYMETNGKRYKNHYAAIRQWMNKDIDNGTLKPIANTATEPKVDTRPKKNDLSVFD